MTREQIVLSIAVISAVTILIRALPFWLFNDKRTPGWITRLGGTLPYAVMGMLVVYCLKDVSFADVSGFLPALISVLAVVVSYVLKRSTLLSIILGTLIYMALVQFVFV